MKRKNQFHKITIKEISENIINKIKKLFSDNENNKNHAESEGGYGLGYYEGYHDAILDVYNTLGIKHSEDFCN